MAQVGLAKMLPQLNIEKYVRVWLIALFDIGNAAAQLMIEKNLFSSSCICCFVSTNIFQQSYTIYWVYENKNIIHK